MFWITGVVILCLIILIYQMIMIDRPIKWEERSVEQDYENLSETDKEIRDAEVEIRELNAERIKLGKLKKLNNRKFTVYEDVVKLREEIERIGEGRQEGVVSCQRNTQNN